MRTISQPASASSTVWRDGRFRVHRVARDHRLDPNRIRAADADAAHHHLAGGAALVAIRIFAVVHCLPLGGLQGEGAAFSAGGDSFREDFWSLLAKQIANIEEADVEHVADDERGAGGLHPLQDPHVYRLSPDTFNDGQDDVSAIQHRNRQHIEDRQVDVEDDAKPKRELPAVLALEQHIIDAHDHDGAAHVLELHVRAGRRHGAERLSVLVML